MAMDFFAQQAQARRNTRWLVLLYVAAVVMIVVAVYIAVALVFQRYWVQLNAAEIGPVLARPGEIDLVPHWYPQVFLGVAGITIAIVATGTIYKISQLAGGGATVAAMLGGRPLLPDTTDAA